MIDFLNLSPSFAQMLVRLFISLVVTWFIIFRLYYKKSKHREFCFTFMLISIAIFFIVFFMVFVLEDMKGKTSMGIGIGLFGIFSIMRYRTDAMPVREMTYLFVIIALALVNAIAEGVPMFELILTNLIILAAVWIFETTLKTKPTKYIQYDRMELVVPEKKDELKADLEKRLGVRIIKVEVGAVDFIRDMAMVRIVYEGLQTPANSKLKLKNSVSYYLSIDIERFGNGNDLLGHLRTYVDFHTVTHIEYLVHLAPVCLRAVVDSLEQRGYREHIVLDDAAVVAYEVEYFGLCATRAMYHTMNLETQLVKQSLNDWSVGACG